MSIDVRTLLQKCKMKMQKRESNAAFGMVSLVPNKPLLLIFLGKHKEDYIEEVKRTLDMNWVAHSQSMLYKKYETPEKFQAALNEDEDGNIELEDAVISQCNVNKGFVSPANVILAYFLNVDEDTEKFIEILDKPFSPVAAGVITRFLFVMGKTSRTKDKKRMKQTLSCLDSYAKGENKRNWIRNYAVIMSDCMRGGATISEEEIVDRYSVFAELLLIYNSRNNNSGEGFTLILPELTEENNNFITSAFKRKEKPRDEINRVVLWKYIELCMRKSSEVDDEISVEDMRETCKRIGENFLNEEVGPKLPTNEDMKGLPFGVTKASEVGEIPNREGKLDDKTFGVWKLYKKKYFQDIVANSISKEEGLEFYLEKELGALGCGRINDKFDSLLRIIKEDEDFFEFFKIASGNESLLQYGLKATAETMKQQMILSLEKVIKSLIQKAGEYQEELAHFSRVVYPQDLEIKEYYEPLMSNYLDMAESQGVIDKVKTPCLEDELEKRIDTMYENLLNSDQGRRLLLSFEEELQARTGVIAANALIAATLFVTEAQMQEVIQMPLVGVDKIGDYSFVNPNAGFVTMADGALFNDSKIFPVSRTDCLDRVAFYKFTISNII